jgi:hypothetical protein
MPLFRPLNHPPHSCENKEDRECVLNPKLALRYDFLLPKLVSESKKMYM